MLMYFETSKFTTNHLILTFLLSQFKGNLFYFIRKNGVKFVVISSNKNRMEHFVNKISFIKNVRKKWKWKKDKIYKKSINGIMLVNSNGNGAMISKIRLVWPSFLFTGIEIKNNNLFHFKMVIKPKFFSSHFFLWFFRKLFRAIKMTKSIRMPHICNDKEKNGLKKKSSQIWI